MNKVDNFIKSTFLKLTSKTYPYGFEDDLVSEMKACGVLPKEIQKDQWGNYFVQIGTSRTIFTSHLDTACKNQVDVKHVIDGKIIKTDGKSILGADDKAGVTILLWLIKNKIPGLYYFFIGEEVGCIGSGLASSSKEFLGNWDRMISFDRRGTNSVITFQSGSRTCSEQFATALSRQLNSTGNLNYKPDDTGIYTDSAEFVSIIPECTNISVGYYQEHTTSEHQDIEHLQKLAISVLNVNWEELPTKRDHTISESKWNKFNSHSDRYNTYDNYDEYYHRESDYGYFPNYHQSSKRNRKRNRKKNRQVLRDFESLNTLNSKEFLDAGGGELLYVDSLRNTTQPWEGHRYEAVKEKIFETHLTKEELNIVKEQYLDMNNPEDKRYYDLLLNSIYF